MTPEASSLQSQPLPFGERRADFRHRTFLSRARLDAPGEPPREAELLDISIYGCRLMIDTSAGNGEKVEVVLSGSNPVSATLVWNEGGRIGCRFDEPIERSLFRSLNLAA